MTTTSGVADSNALFQDNRNVVSVTGRNTAEDGAGHPAQGRRFADRQPEWTPVIPENNPVLRDLQRIETAGDGVLEPDKTFDKLSLGQAVGDSFRRPVLGLHLATNSSADSGHGILCQIWAASQFNGLRELHQESPEKGFTAEPPFRIRFLQQRKSVGSGSTLREGAPTTGSLTATALPPPRRAATSSCAARCVARNRPRPPSANGSGSCVL